MNAFEQNLSKSVHPNLQLYNTLRQDTEKLRVWRGIRKGVELWSYCMDVVNCGLSRRTADVHALLYIHNQRSAYADAFHTCSKQDGDLLKARWPPLFVVLGSTTTKCQMSKKENGVCDHLTSIGCGIQHVHTVQLGGLHGRSRIWVDEEIYVTQTTWMWPFWRGVYIYIYLCH